MKPGHESEEAFLNRVMAFSREHGWKSAHFRAARTEHGWRTAVSGDGKGFCDLLLVRERVIFAELKAKKGKLSPEQQAWSEVLKEAKQEVYLWFPKDWPEIKRILA